MKVMAEISKIFFMLLVSLPLRLSAQSYINYTPNGYINIREKPNAKSKIIGKMQKFEILDHASTICGSEISYDSVPANWIPLVLYKNDAVYRYGTFIPGHEEVGYAYKKHLKEISEMPELSYNLYADFVTIYTDTLLHSERVEAQTDSIFWGNEQNGIFISIDHCDTIRYHYDFESKTINGYTPINWYGLETNNIIAFKEISIFYKKKKYTIPKDRLKPYFFGENFLQMAKTINKGVVTEFNRNIVAHTGSLGEIHLSIWGGDAAGKYSITWVFFKGRIVSEYCWTAC